MSRQLIRRIISQEAIDYQHGRTLFTELAGIFGEFIAQEDISEASCQTLSKNLALAINHATGIYVIVKVIADKKASPTLCIGTPIVNPSNPLLELTKKSYKAPRFPVEALRKISSSLEGTVDLKKGKVTGVFTKIASTVFISANLIMPNMAVKGLVLTPEELSAALLHEIGHAFTYYELLATTVMTNYALDLVVTSLRGETDKVKRIKLIEAAAEGLEAKVPDATKLAEQTDESVIQSVLLNAAVENSRSATGSRVYEYRNAEFLADQFATQQGAAKALATSVEKFAAWQVGLASLQNKWSVTHMAFTVLRTVMDIGLLPVYAIMLALPDMDVMSYDPPQERLGRIKRTLIQAIKDDRLSSIQRDELLSDIATVDETLSRIASESRRPLFMALWQSLTSDRRARAKQTKYQQDLEALASNDLFVAGHQLAALSTSS
jgi:hypothetical protein